MSDRKYWLLFVVFGLILVPSGMPYLISELERSIGDKDRSLIEESISKEMDHDTERVKKYFGKAKAEVQLQEEMGADSNEENHEPGPKKNRLGFRDSRRVKKYFGKAKAEVQLQEEMGADSNEENHEPGPKKNRLGFRDSRIVSYEDRIRAYSTPDKIFRYFGTVQDQSGEVYMTPQDFVRSITPGVKQPEGMGLDSFRRVDLKLGETFIVNDQDDVQNLTVKNDVAKDSVFYRFGEHALINFSDYVFLLSVICTPCKQFEIAFRMFDLNGDGELDLDEFEVVRSIIRSGSAMGRRHRDNSVTGSTINNGMNSSLSIFFFGNDGHKKLTIRQFLDFQAALQREIMHLEYNRYDLVDGKLREVDFADALLMYAGFSENKKRKFIRRVKQKFGPDETKGITFDDYVNFSHFLRCISDVDTALTFYHLAGASIDPEMFKHVSKAVANVDLCDHIIDVVFTLFDENNDNHLSNREFISVMKQRLLRGLDKPMDTGFIRLLSAMTGCAKKVILSTD